MIDKSNGIITIKYNKEEILNQAILISSYIAKSIDNSAAYLDKFVITSDEEELSKECLTQAMSHIYDSLIDLMSGVDTAFESETGDIIVKIKDNKACEQRHIENIESILRDCFVYRFLVEYYSVIINAELYSMSSKKFIENMAKLKKAMFVLLKKRTFSLT